MFLLLAALGVEPARAAFISGHSYTSVADWAGANGFRVQLRRGAGILLTNRTQARLGLQNGCVT